MLREPRRQGQILRIPPRFTTAASLAACLLLVACSGGGGDINLGSGQAADPVTVDFAVAYVKRTVPREGDDLQSQRATAPDADLFIRDRASPSSTERNVTERITRTDRYDVKDVDVSSDGRKVIFAMRGPLAANQDDEDPPTWGIWEYEIATDTLRRVIASDTVASEGHDVAPHYLPDGRIVFSSTRQRQSQAILRDEGKPGFEAQLETGGESAFVLHVMRADGSDIRQVSFNQSHDLDPTVLSDGRLLWSRWDAASGRGIHLYTANPDGSNLQLLYGARSHATGSGGSTVQFVEAREMQDGRVLALIRPFEGTQSGGDLVMIDVRNYVDNLQIARGQTAVEAVQTPPSTPAQVRATFADVTTVPGPSPGGRFQSAFPLWDGTNRLLVTWSPCRLLEGTAIVPCTPARLAAANPVAADPLYSAWIFDPQANTLRPLFEPVEGVMVTDLVAAQPRQLPAVILDRVAGLDFDPSLQADGVGILDIRSVYDFDGRVFGFQAGAVQPTIPDLMQRPAPLRPARFLRLEKAVSLPDDDVRDIDNAAFGTVRFMREILGYAPIEPDGSVRVRVPANVAFQISILDQDGRRISSPHRNWLQLRPGETRTCNGCHATNTTPSLSHGRDGQYQAAWAGGNAGTAFAGAAPTAPRPQAGETMAQTRARAELGRSTVPSVDLIYTDAWGAGNAPLTLGYRTAGGFTGLSTAPPTSSACQISWASTCRIIVNYKRHIHPLWSVSRPVLAADGVTVLADNRCTSCHSPSDAGLSRVPAAQLDLSDGDSQEEPLQFQAYRELLFTDNQQEVNMGVLADTLVNNVPVTVQPSLVAGSARASTRFFNRFATGGSHAGYLTAAELRLISEWVDIGAQYFNNPFDPEVPLD
jgi:hypothetical protein